MSDFKFKKKYAGEGLDIEPRSRIPIGTNIPPESWIGLKSVLCEYSHVGELSHCGHECKIGDGCTFGDSCRFLEECTIGDDCSFGDYCGSRTDCIFGECCKFGDYCKFYDGCEFGDNCVFGDGCRFGEGCVFGDDCIFGDNCVFGEVYYDHHLQPICVGLDGKPIDRRCPTAYYGGKGGHTIGKNYRLGLGWRIKKGRVVYKAPL